MEGEKGEERGGGGGIRREITKHLHGGCLLVNSALKLFSVMYYTLLIDI